jgi:hypothetical protein
MSRVEMNAKIGALDIAPATKKKAVPKKPLDRS